MFKKNSMEFFVRLLDYLYYFYKWLYTTSPWSHVLLECSMTMWYDYLSFPCYLYLLEYISQESPIKVDDWGSDYAKCSIKRGLLDAYKRLMWNGDKSGVWDIIRHQEWRKNDVGTKSECCSSLQHSCKGTTLGSGLVTWVGSHLRAVVSPIAFPLSSFLSHDWHVVWSCISNIRTCENTS